MNFPFPPTDEQQFVIDRVLTGCDFKVVAYAGAAKTTTLQMIADALGISVKILYVAYNKAIQLEAEGSFPFNTLAKTAHGLLWRNAISHFGNARMNHKALTAFPEKLKTLSRHRATHDLYDDILGSLLPDRYSVGRRINATLNKFQNSDSYVVMPHHVPYDELQVLYLKALDNGSKMDQKDFVRIVGGAIAEAAQTVWDDMVRKDSHIPIGYDTYLKWAALQDPKLPFDVILMDEWQDANPVLIKLFADQDCQKICVGDPHQQIYSFRGSNNALSNVDAEEGRLTTSFRFGENIAEFANIFLGYLDETVPLKGGSPDPGVITSNPGAQATLCRTNVGTFIGALEAIEQGYETAIVGGAKEAARLIKGVYALYTGGKSKHSALELFDNWSEFVDYSESKEGSSMKPIVRFVEMKDDEIPEICNSLEFRTVSEKHADRVFSTAHKAKGREWDSVELASDYRPACGVDEDGQPFINREEMRLQYVAATRAKKVLNPGDIPMHLSSYAKAINR